MERLLFAVHGRQRYAIIQALRTYPHTASVYPFGDELHYSDVRRAAEPTVIAEELTAYLRTRGFADARVTAIQPGIEDTFMALMGAPEASAA